MCIYISFSLTTCHAAAVDKPFHHKDTSTHLHLQSLTLRERDVEPN